MIAGIRRKRGAEFETSERQEFLVYPVENRETIPETISKNYLNIKTLKLEYSFSEEYKKAIDSISNIICGWRKVRGDGNCYYRSVIIAYVLKILHPYQGNTELSKFVSILNRAKKSGKFAGSVEKISVFFKGVLESRKTYEEKLKHFEKINTNLQDKNFDRDLVCTARAIALESLNLPDHGIIKVFIEDLDLVIHNVSSFGTEAEGAELRMLPVGLDIKVVQYNNNLGGKFLVSEFFNDSVEKDYLVVNIICKTRGHYDILYSVRDMENEEYNYYNGSYSLSRNKVG